MEPNVEPFEFYIQAYSELSSCRHAGMNPLPIPFTAIVEYARLYDVGDFEEFKYLIRRVDNSILYKDKEKSDVSSGQGDKSKGSSGG